MEVEQETAGFGLAMETAEGEETMTRLVRYLAQSSDISRKQKSPERYIYENVRR